MMRNIFVVSLLCLTLAFGLAACNQKDDSPRIGVVNVEKAFQNSKLAKSGMDHIEGISKKFNERLSEMQAAATADPENQELMQQFQAELMNLQGDFEARQTEVGNKINRLFEEVVAEYREKNNLEVIISSQMVLSTRTGADVTDGIIQLLDTKTIDFGSVDAPAAVTPPPAPAGNEAAPAPAGEGAAK